MMFTLRVNTIHALSVMCSVPQYDRLNLPLATF